MFIRFGSGGWVPNVPCGVERADWFVVVYWVYRVPNVPCGVEGPIQGEDLLLVEDAFLMYRVELKVSKDIRKPFHCRPF